ncbi:hypothetical protein KC340_g73 [Hortaea werneckii]|nr:hypothetical protein KC340_g73 [Hortaea werneckii]
MLGGREGIWARGRKPTYLSLQVADQHPIQNLPGLVAVAYVLESLSRILAAYVKEDFFTASGHQLASCVQFPCRTKLLDGYVVRADRQSGRARDAAVGTLAGMRKHWGKKTNTLSWMTMYRSFLEVCSLTSEISQELCEAAVLGTVESGYLATLCSATQRSLARSYLKHTRLLRARDPYLTPPINNGISFPNGVRSHETRLLQQLLRMLPLCGLPSRSGPRIRKLPYVRRWSAPFPPLFRFLSSSKAIAFLPPFLCFERLASTKNAQSKPNCGLNKMNLEMPCPPPTERAWAFSENT